MGKRTTPVDARFWSHVDKPVDGSACWLWTAQRDRKGYGNFYVPAVMP